jgi:hypothetical protein
MPASQPHEGVVREAAIFGSIRYRLEDSLFGVWLIAAPDECR